MFEFLENVIIFVVAVKVFEVLPYFSKKPHFYTKENAHNFKM